MRLIPHDEWIAAGTFAHVRPGHLSPTRTLEPPALRQSFRRWQLTLIPLQILREQRVIAPQRKMRRMPPDHFSVMLAVPRRARQPRLLRRHIACHLHGHEITRADHPLLDLVRARIGASGKIQRRALHPKQFPTCGTFSERRIRCHYADRQCRLPIKSDCELKPVIPWQTQKGARCLRLDSMMIYVPLVVIGNSAQ